MSALCVKRKDNDGDNDHVDEDDHACCNDAPLKRRKLSFEANPPSGISKAAVPDGTSTAAPAAAPATSKMKQLFLPYHLDILKSLYDGNDNEDDDSPMGPETIERIRSFLESRPDLIRSKKEAGRWNDIHEESLSIIQESLADVSSSHEKQNAHYPENVLLIRSSSSAIVSSPPKQQLATSNASISRLAFCRQWSPLMTAPSANMTTTQQGMTLSSSCFSGSTACSNSHQNGSLSRQRHLFPPSSSTSSTAKRRQQPEQQVGGSSFSVISNLLIKKKRLHTFHYQKNVRMYKDLLQTARHQIHSLNATLQTQQQAVRELRKKFVEQLLSCNTVTPERRDALAKGTYLMEWNASHLEPPPQSAATITSKMKLWALLVHDLSIIVVGGGDKLCRAL